MTELSGIQSLIASASRCRVSAVYGVPGFPITDVVNSFIDSGEFSRVTEWFSNEKIAFEWGLGASFSGKRVIVAVKHVGMNVLADPLRTAGIHAIGAGLVILAGDDPEVSGSQNSQDSRYYGSLSRSPVFDPSTPQEIYDYLEQAFLISETLKLPVILRVTDAVLKETQSVQEAEVENTSSQFSSFECDKSIWNFRTKGRYQRSHFDNDSVLFDVASYFCDVSTISFSNENVAETVGTIGIIVSGKCFARVENILSSLLSSLNSNDISFSSAAVMKLGIVSPLSVLDIRFFLEKYETVLVVEESEPFIEDQIRIFGNVLGKRTGHLPFGNVSEEEILSALKNLNAVSVFRPFDVDAFKRDLKGLDFCGDRLYPRFYEMLGDVKKETGAMISGDIGCLMHGIVPPCSVLDSAVSLGAGIGIGSGVSRSLCRKSIVVIGDFGFSHSGLLSLVEAAEKGVSLLVYVMHNSAAAMTGGQKTSDPEELIRAALLNSKFWLSSFYSCSFDVSASVSDFDADMEKLRVLSLNEMEKEGISVIVVHWNP